MISRWDYGDAVRVARNVRDDGTFPGASRGELLIRRGSIGHVVDKGTFLMDQVIYSVHFVEAGRIVGCREEELLDIADPWVDTRFESRDRVRAARILTTAAGARVHLGAGGEILKVLRDAPDGPAYHVHFECLPGKPLVVREAALAPFDDGGPDGAAGQ